MIKVSDSETPFSHQWSKSLEFSFKATTTIVNAISANMPAKMLTSDHIEDAALRKFRDWIATQPHIKNPIVGKLSDGFLVRSFLIQGNSFRRQLSAPLSSSEKVQPQ